MFQQHREHYLTSGSDKIISNQSDMTDTEMHTTEFSSPDFY